MEICKKNKLKKAWIDKFSECSEIIYYFSKIHIQSILMFLIALKIAGLSSLDMLIFIYFLILKKKNNL